MNKFFLNILYTLFLILLLSCQSVSKKIENSQDKEQKELSKWLDKAESELKNFYGQPDRIEFLDSRNRNYVFVTEKYYPGFRVEKKTALVFLVENTLVFF